MSSSREIDAPAAPASGKSRSVTEPESGSRGAGTAGEQPLLAPVLDAVPNGVAIAAADGRITWVNRELQHMFGQPSSAVRGRPVSVLAGPYAGQAEGRALIDAVRDGHGSLELAAYSASGAALPVAIRVATIEGGDAAGNRLVSVSDLSGQRRLEASLIVKAEAARRDRQLVRAIAESISRPVVVLDDSERVTLVNGPALQLFGFSAEEALGRSLVELVVPAPVRRAWLSFLASSKSESDAVVTVDGEAVTSTLRLRFARARSSDGVALGSLLVIGDPAGLSGARTIDDFLVALTHELRTPLVSIQGFSRTLCEEPELDDKLRKEFLGIVRREADRLNHLAEEMLQLVMLEAEAGAPSPVPQDLHELVTRCIDEITSEEDIERSSIRVEAPGEATSIQVEPRRFKELLRGLALNAVRHGASEKGLAVSLSADGPSCRITVRDWGPGVAAEQLESIFEPFRRAGAAGESSGPGLGLYVCRMIVERAGGAIWAEAPVGGGLRIVTELPADPPRR